MSRSFAPEAGPPDVADVLRRGARQLPATQHQSLVDLLDDVPDSAAARKYDKKKATVRQARFKALRELRRWLAEEVLGLDPAALRFLSEYYLTPPIAEEATGADELSTRAQEHVAGVLHMTREQVSARHAQVMSRLASGARRLELHRRHQAFHLIVTRYILLPSQPEASAGAAENPRAEFDAMRTILVDFLAVAPKSPTA